jgi:hypothetical protein
MRRTVMLPDERMVEAARDAGDNLGVELTRDVIAAMLKCAFAALDRDELVSASVKALRATGQELHLVETAEAVLRAVGLLP